MTTKKMLALYRDKCPGFNVRHIHEKLKHEKKIEMSYVWAKQAQLGKMESTPAVMQGVRKVIERKGVFCPL